MRVYVYPADLGGCGYYRLTWPAQFLASQGHDIKIVHPKHVGRIKGVHDENDPKKLIDISVPTDADVMVFQRVTSVQMITGFELIRKRGIAVVVDVDDDMRAIHPSNPMYESLHPTTTHDNMHNYSWQWAEKVYAAATLVTTSTDTLLDRYARRDPVTGKRVGVVLHNAVPDVYREIEPRPIPDTIGWAGNVATHPDDPQVVGSSMARLQRSGYTFRVVGPDWKVKSTFGLEEDPDSTGPVELARYPHFVKTLGVGIAPLSLTRFNEAKSWLKMLEYAALGVPCIGSPTREYLRLHHLGVGAIAQNPREWYRLGRRLLDSESARQEMIEAGRAATQRLTIATNAWRWLEAWSCAYDMEKSSSSIR